MKKIILISLFSCLVLNAGNVYDMKIDKIKKEREGINKEVLKNTKEPFAVVKITEKKKEMIVPDIVVEEEKTFSLNAIMNKRAYINGNWQKEGDVIEGYTLKYVGNKGVVLRKDNEIKKVFLQGRAKKKLNIIIK